ASRAAAGRRVKLPPARLQHTGRDYFALMARLFEISGYSGWLILFDEFELVCKMGTQARGRSYANLNTFVRPKPLPGFEHVTAVVTLIDQMVSEYLVAGKDDLKYATAYFRHRAAPETAAHWE